ncbi:tRNA dimethylallyltransferase [Defluviimonas aquaemixtae]|uniref:tRNA dimethylallyltransferase n=1 Tax=Albidovulum aquaemixtae TaxID=1542388 RepID=A0A2R8B5W8_9RHOB|nr:tRNA dimethylallyltransferase [Defluviimonas aquaemixtae]
MNADALQVWSCWHVLTARPSAEEETRAPHLLYGHMAPGAPYSVGHWLREVAPLLGAAERPIIVGGTGLYLSALTEGLADIPPTPAEIRAEADAIMAKAGPGPMLDALDRATRSRIDTRNPVRVQRAWEVLRSTGQGLAAWQDETGSALLPRDRATTLLLDADRDWLADRIDRRFRRMVAEGALDEVRANLDRWDPGQLWARAIGAAELVAHLQGQTSLEDAITAAQAASRQYAKRQRSWFRGRMANWLRITPP